MIPWEKNPSYPTKFGACGDCKHDGPVKLAWDLRRYICLDAKSCLARTFHRTPDIRSEIPEIEDESSFFTKSIKKISTNKSVNGIQYFTCEKCNTDFQRPATRGRPPKLCPKCRA